MKTKHTPGPWQVCVNAPSLIEADIGHEDRLPRTIAKALDPIPYIGDETVNANARMIAAAPELLAELMKVEELLLAISATDYPVSDEISSLQAVIAKATGATVPRRPTSSVKPTTESKDAARYRWLRDVSVPPHNFYLSVPTEFDGVRYTPAEVDAYIDQARGA